MAGSPAPSGSLRQRNVAAVLPPSSSSSSSSSRKTNRDAASVDVELDKLAKHNAAAAAATTGSERDYKIAFVLITAAAFLTRFWGITHPSEVVFDEVHFGKVWSLAMHPGC